MAFAVGEQVVALAKMKGSGGNKVKPGWKGHCIALEPKYVSFSFEIKHDSLFGNIQGFTTVKLSHEEAATKVSRVVTNSSQTYERPASKVSFTQSATVSPLERNLSTSEIIEKLTQLKNLRDSGVLTDEEFNNFKVELTSKNADKSSNTSENSVGTNLNKPYDVWVVGIGGFEQSKALFKEIENLIELNGSNSLSLGLKNKFKELERKSRTRILINNCIEHGLAISNESKLKAMGLLVEVTQAGN